MAEIVLFGAGHHTLNYIRLLNYFQCEVDCIADNDAGKTGRVFHGIPVIRAEELVWKDCRILISCTYWKEITEQLSSMGIADKIISLQDLLKEAAAQRENLRKTLPVNSSRKICVDLYSMTAWGGAENWNYNLAKELAKAGCGVRILASPVISIDESDVKGDCVSIRRFQKENHFADMVEEMMGQLPIVFLNCFTEELFFAALAVKAICPDQIHIIDEVHLDLKQAYGLHVQFEPFIDQYICVSRRIKETLNKVYGIRKERLFFKEQPIETEKTYQKNYVTDPGRPIRIGYAARLVRQQKRADFLPAFLEKLNGHGIDYRLEIAGDGEEETVIKEEIKRRGLDLKARFLGRLNYSGMSDFWKRQDIYLNFSEYEGASLAMIEAMSFGCVPVVTDVSGAADYIENERSGYICPIGDLDALADKIFILYENRLLIEKFGQEARNSVLSKCKKEEYVKILRQWMQN